MADTHCPECATLYPTYSRHDQRLGYEPGCAACYGEPELADRIYAYRAWALGLMREEDDDQA